MTASVQRGHNWGGPLTDTDYAKLLEESWISRDIADRAMLRRVSAQEGREIVGRRGNIDCSGLLLPYYLPDEPGPHSYRIRRDNPDYRLDADGNPKPDKKYLGAPKAGNRIYFPPGIAAEQLTDTALPIVIVEGEKKALALQRLAHHESGGARWIAVAFPGVWNWLGVVGKTGGPNGERLDVRGPISDLDLMVWDERQVLIVFDRNVQTNDQVGWARKGLAAELAKRRAHVDFINLPLDCGLNGVDDLLAAWGPERVLQLFDSPVSGTRLEVKLPPEYRATAEGMFRLTVSGDKVTRIPLTNYRATIVASLALDDGVESRREFEIQAECFGRRSRFSISASAFATMEWPMEKLGAGAITHPHKKDYARAAIQSFSFSAPETCVYTHTGWREINGQYVFLHAGGTLGHAGSVGDVQVRLPSPFSHYELVPPASRNELAIAVKRTFRFIDPAISLPLRAATVRSVFGNADFSLHLSGATGTFKSELAALEQQFFGVSMNRMNLPGTWSSTPNALEMLAFNGKDVLAVIDDFAPSGNQGDVARYHATAERVFRAAGNRSGRGRLDSTARMREGKPPRGLILSTGEEIPNGQSIRARLLILEVSKSQLDPGKLTECQQYAAAGLYVQAMSGFVVWVAAQYSEIKDRMACRTIELRKSALQNPAHARTPDIFANLLAAWELYLEFAESCGAIEHADRERLARDCRQALTSAASAQARYQAASEPTNRYLSLLRGCLASGQAHLAGMDGGRPYVMPEACGWRTSGEGYPAGLRIGWVDAEHIYIEPSVAYEMVQIAGRNSGESLAISAQTLGRRLREKGLLASTDTKRGTLTIRRTLSGCQQNVWHFRRDVLLPLATDEVGKSDGE